VTYKEQHAEHPGPTNPNRQFATSGSTCGLVDNTVQSYGWQLNTTGTNCTMSIFESLSNKGISWKNVSMNHVTTVRVGNAYAPDRSL
jgi:phospholipase C